MNKPALIGVLIVATVAFAGPARGQQGFLVNPGARSIGLGGAFAAIADDATAAFANPSGLVQIARPEVSVEFRGTAATSSFGLAFERDAGVTGLGFVSFVYPARRWSLAVYSHQLASLDFTFNGTIPYTRELTIRSYSAAAAFKISERISLGAGVSSFNGDRNANPYEPHTSDSDWGLNAGLLWTLTDHWRLAAFYRQGPTFEGEAVPLPLDPGGASLVAPLFDVPDVSGIGAAFRPGGGGLILGLEIDRIAGFEDSRYAGTTISDGGTDLHIGAEYAVLKWKPVVAFRLGIWRATVDGLTTVLGPDLMTHSGGDGASHVAFGAGVAFKKFQLDVGADISDDAVLASVSMVISF